MQEQAAQLIEAMPNRQQLPKKQQLSWCACNDEWLIRDPTLIWRKEDVAGISDDFNEAFPPVGVQSGNQPVRGA